MSWLDFANYFLSNQKLHAWSWINRTSLGNGFFWWVFRLLCVFGFWFFWLFLFSVFLFSARREKRSLAHGILVGNQREKTTLGHGFLFFLLFIWWQFCIVQILSGPKTFLHISSVFLRSLIRSFLSFFFFLFYFLPFFDWEFSFFSFCFLPLFDWEFPFFSFFAFSLIGNFPSLLFCFRG